MSAKHAVLDRKLFQWVRENRTRLSVPDAIFVLRVHNKDERRHINRRFVQMRARGLIRLIQQTPTEVYETCGVIPYDTSRPEWINANQGLRRPRSQEPIRATVSICAVTSEEFLAAGGAIEILEAPAFTPYKGSRPTGHRFSFDD